MEHPWSPPIPTDEGNLEAFSSPAQSLSPKPENLLPNIIASIEGSTTPFLQRQRTDSVSTVVRIPIARPSPVRNRTDRVESDDSDNSAVGSDVALEAVQDEESDFGPLTPLELVAPPFGPLSPRLEALRMQDPPNLQVGSFHSSESPRTRRFSAHNIRQNILAMANEPTAQRGFVSATLPRPTASMWQVHDPSDVLSIRPRTSDGLQNQIYPVYKRIYSDRATQVEGNPFKRRDSSTYEGAAKERPFSVISQVVIPGLKRIFSVDTMRRQDRVPSPTPSKDVKKTSEDGAPLIAVPEKIQTITEGAHQATSGASMHLTASPETVSSSPLSAITRPHSLFVENPISPSIRPLATIAELTSDNPEEAMPPVSLVRTISSPEPHTSDEETSDGEPLLSVPPAKPTIDNKGKSKQVDDAPTEVADESPAVYAEDDIRVGESAHSPGWHSTGKKPESRFWNIKGFQMPQVPEFSSLTKVAKQVKTVYNQSLYDKDSSQSTERLLDSAVHGGGESSKTMQKKSSKPDSKSIDYKTFEPDTDVYKPVLESFIFPEPDGFRFKNSTRTGRLCGESTMIGASNTKFTNAANTLSKDRRASSNSYNSEDEEQVERRKAAEAAKKATAEKRSIFGRVWGCIKSFFCCSCRRTKATSTNTTGNKKRPRTTSAVIVGARQDALEVEVTLPRDFNWHPAFGLDDPNAEGYAYQDGGATRVWRGWIRIRQREEELRSQGELNSNTVISSESSAERHRTNKDNNSFVSLYRMGSSPFKSKPCNVSRSSSVRTVIPSPTAQETTPSKHTISIRPQDKISPSKSRKSPKRGNSSPTKKSGKPASTLLVHNTGYVPQVPGSVHSSICASNTSYRDHLNTPIAGAPVLFTNIPEWGNSYTGSVAGKTRGPLQNLAQQRLRRDSVTSKNSATPTKRTGPASKASLASLRSVMSEQQVRAGSSAVRMLWVPPDPNEQSSSSESEGGDDSMSL